MIRVLLSFFLFSSFLSFASEQNRVIESVRNLGRGDTYVAAYDFDRAAFFNPATPAEHRIGYQLRLLQMDTIFLKF